MTWTAILQGDLAKQAQEAIEDLAEQLAVVPKVPIHDIHTLSLGWGLSGIVLFYDYLIRSGHTSYQSVKDAYLDLILENLENVTPSPNGYAGFPGIAWTLAHLAKSLNLKHEDFEDFDNYMLSLLDLPPEKHAAHDLVIGLLPCALYALERGEHPRTNVLLTRLLKRIQESAHQLQRGTAWFSLGAQTPEVETFPDGIYYPGVSHGTAGALALLAALSPRGFQNSNIEDLLSDGISWLGHLTESYPKGFPFTVDPTEKPGKVSFPAWCHGEMGIAPVVLACSQLKERRDWEQIGINMANNTMARHAFRTDPIAGGISLCHGHSGRGHLFNRIYHQVGEPAYRDEALFWFQRLLATRRPGQGLAGWTNRDLTMTDDEFHSSFPITPGVLEGIAGVGLSLIAGVYPEEPYWDRLLLASPLVPIEVLA